MLIGVRADLGNLVRLSGVAWVWGVTTSAYAVGEAFRRAVVGFARSRFAHAQNLRELSARID